ncbi:MAG TPA: peptidoglycan DD-metalloendopeptidase family protein [Chloroflexota bacterium]|nr:peptidoglycan DD-metalloendopeptidase family protein [Chloroflexota bacterium]
MRRSPIDDYVQVSVEEFQPSFPWSNLPYTLATLQPNLSTLSNRWPTADLGTYLQRRATVHMSVLVLATAVLAGSAMLNRAPAEVAAPPLAAAAASDSLGLSGKTAIVARAIPFTNQGSDSSYTVQPGDTLTAIARRVGVNEEALLAFNGFSSSDALNVGLRLRIPDLSKVPPEQLRVKDTAPHDSMPLVGSAVLPPQKASPDLTIHAIEKGDSAYKLALDTGVSEATVLASNNLKANTILSLGQTLVIPSLNGRVVATRPGDTVDGLAQQYSSTPEGVIAANKLDPRTRELAGDQLVLVPSDPDVAVAILKDTPRAGAAPQADSKPVAGAKPASPAAPALSAQSETAPAKAAPAPRPASSPSFIWPATGMLTTYFSGWHNGIDIANSVGTPVHAVQAGRVVSSAWDNSGYGYMVRIDHGDGLQTLYGHASRLLVHAGEYVDQGDTIMLMGSTGRSTGSHVHFSIFQGGSYSGYNPLKYLP